MIAFVLWYLLITLIGWLAFPAAYRLLPHLSDRGYALARPLGLLLWGYFFWLLVSFRLLENTAGGILLALLLLAAVSAWLGRGNWAELRSWLGEHKRQILTTEVVFLTAFALWALVRAMNPDITGTEKPMEQAFINAILRSPTFPPHDPWLSGYAISYYYFGYVMVAMLAKLTGVTTGVAFNLAIALWFALTAVSAYGILYSLLSRRFTSEHGSRAAWLARGWALLAPIFLLLVSNLEGFLEMLHARGLFWQQTGAGWSSAVWRWLDIQELVSPPTLPLTWIPNRPGGIWWWRASRVLQDFNLTGQPREVIDEFPFFSYLLADLHPHVLAMPFALLAVGMAMNFYLHAREQMQPEMGLFKWIRLWSQESQPAFRKTRFGIWLRSPDFWLAAVVLGSLAFVNTWDFPIYVALFSGAYVLAVFQQDGWRVARIIEFLETAFVLVVAGIVLFLPFYFGFSSQAGGFLPSLSYYTRGVQFWIMFGSLLLPVAGWLVYMWTWRGSRSNGTAGLKFAALIIIGLWLLSYLLAALILTVLANVGQFASLSSLFLDMHGAEGPGQLLAASLVKRLSQPGMWLTMLVLLTLVWGLLASYRPRRQVDPAGEILTEIAQPTPSPVRTANAFVLLLILLGAGLVVIPEFVYLRDQFGWRMNTIFKFYFQTWLMWSLAAAYASAVLWQSLRSIWKYPVRIVWGLVMLMALVYPVFGLQTKTDGFQTNALTLDGNAYIARYDPDEMAAIRWLQQAPAGVVSEAVTGSYQSGARISTLTGQPSVLGWPGHESQWRGGAKEMGSRETDIDRLYRSNDWNDTLSILQQYHIRYVYVGSLERGTYHVAEAKFQAHLHPVFQNNSVTIYEVSNMTPLPEPVGG